MSEQPPRNLEASVKARLLTLARAQREEFQSVLTRYAVERFLYRLSVSPFRERFILKGASLFTLWLRSPHRSTRDLDLLGFGNQEAEKIAEVFRSLCHQPVPDDGLIFGADTMSVTTAREEEKYAGLRVVFRASLGSAVIPMQVDIGFGDIVTPAASESEMPSLLDSPRAHLLSYPRETVVAEKCEAMIDLGLSNSRLKDFYDLQSLAAQFDFDGALLRSALAATLSRRGTLVPELPPPALTAAFSKDASRARQWEAFWRKNNPASEVFTVLEDCISFLGVFLLPPLKAVKDRTGFALHWNHKQAQWADASRIAAQNVKGASVHK